MSKILCIYPQDKTTRFLGRLQRELKREFKERFHFYKIKPTEVSHAQCLKRIITGTEELIIFLGHGKSNCLYGSCSDYLNSGITSFTLESENRYSYYKNENFINSENIEVFQDKKVFCLSCNSADGLGALACKKGAKVFIGFGDIPTELDVLPETVVKSKHFTARYKGEIISILKKSLIYSIENNHNFFQLVDTLRLFTNIKINEIILTHKGLRNRRLLADYLFDFKEGIKLFGNGNEKILEQI